MEFSYLSNAEKIVAIEGAIKGTERNIYSQCSMAGIDPETLSYPHVIPDEYRGDDVGGFGGVIAQAHQVLEKLIERRHLLLAEIDSLRN